MQSQPLAGTRSIRPPLHREPTTAHRGRYDTLVPPNNAPAPRSRSVSRYRDTPSDATRETLPRRRSIERIPSNPLPPMPTRKPLSSSTHAPVTRPAALYGAFRSSSDSRSSISSASSAVSIIDRMSARSTASSRTSFEDDSPLPKTIHSGTLRSTRIDSSDEQYPGSPLDETDTATDLGAGTSLWARVAAAAGSLTVNVTKAIETSVANHDGEDTPAGGESRITVALKEYYISRARSGSDLPEWLFNERERRVMGDTRPTHAPTDRDQSRRNYQGADHEPASRPRAVPPAREASGTHGVESKASTRLRAMREARQSPRTPALKLSSPSSSSGRDHGTQSQMEGGGFPGDGVPSKAARVGLPSRPGRLLI